MRFLFVDAITSMTPSSIEGVKCVSDNDFYLFHTHTDSYLFYPALVGETLGQLAAWHAMKALDFQYRPVAGVVNEVLIHDYAYLGDTITLLSEIDDCDSTAIQYHSIAKVNDKPILTINGALGPMLPMADFIDDSVIRTQYTSLLKGSPCVDTLQHKIHTPLTCVAPFSFDTIVNFVAGISIEGTLTVKDNFPFLPDHFPKKPVLPMTVLLSAIESLATTFLTQSFLGVTFRCVAFRRIKMNEFVLPNQMLDCTIQLKSIDNQIITLQSVSVVDGKRVCVASLLFENMM
jgi:3-hydroxymyristoyl/3-hydroxydecanoyl-(acyl carrier protein) dehydratase